jgi:hypothetical protein
MAALVSPPPPPPFRLQIGTAVLRHCGLPAPSTGEGARRTL